MGSHRCGLINVTHATDLGPACNRCDGSIWGYERIDHRSIWGQCSTCHQIVEISCDYAPIPADRDTVELVSYYRDTHRTMVARFAEVS